VTVAARWKTAGAIGLGLGIALRCARLAEARSLWIDESMLALNIAPRGWGNLLGPPLFEQVIPPGFLLLTRLFLTALGGSDWVFRVLPTLGAIVLLLLLFRPLGVRLLGDRGAAILMMLAALSPLLLQFSDELKPYGLDALSAVALPVLALRALDHPARTTGWLGLIAGGMIAMTLGFAPVFVAAGAVIGLASDRKSWASPVRRWWVGVGAVWLAWFSILYGLFIHPRSKIPYLAHFWAPSFPDGGPLRVAREVVEFGGAFFRRSLLGSTGQIPLFLVLLVAGLAGLGAVELWKRQGSMIVAMLTIPSGLGILAGIVHRYPLGYRLWLFAVPPVLILVAGGVEFTLRALPARWRSAGAVAFGLLLIAQPLGGVIPWFLTPAVRDPLPTRDAVQVWRRSAHPGDATYIYHWTIPSWIFYTTDWGSPDRRRFDWFMKSAESLGPNSGNIPSRGHPVVDEGDSLIWRGTLGAELVGIPPGVEALAVPTVETLPDSGWAENEGRRLLAETSGCIWIVFAGGRQLRWRMIVNVLEAAGARVAGRWERASATVVGLDPPARIDANRTSARCDPRVTR
jgi:hypothetical protein